MHVVVALPYKKTPIQFLKCGKWGHKTTVQKAPVAATVAVRNTVLAPTNVKQSSSKTGDLPFAHPRSVMYAMARECPLRTWRRGNSAHF